MSSLSCIPVLVLPNRQDGQDSLVHLEGDAHTTIQHAAGSERSPFLPSTSPPTTSVNFSFDQWTALFNTDCFSNVYPGAPHPDLPSYCGSQVSDLPSYYWCTLPSSMTSDDVSPCHSSPGQLSHASLSPFSMGDVSVPDIAASIQPYPHPIAPLLPPAVTPGSSLPGQTLAPPVLLLDELVTTSWPNVLPSSFSSSSIHMETTALGLYHPDTSQSVGIPSFLTEVKGDAPPPSPSGCVPSIHTSEGWTFRAEDPASKMRRSKSARNDKSRPSDADIEASTSASRIESMIECKECGYVQSKKRMGDFRRHLKKHEADHLTRVVCCGVPSTHLGVASLLPGHLTRWYNNHPFHGGCGRSYSRMDALQRHLKKSGCIGGSSKDHQAWRKLYFSDKTCRPHRRAVLSVSLSPLEQSP